VEVNGLGAPAGRVALCGSQRGVGRFQSLCSGELTTAGTVVLTDGKYVERLLPAQDQRAPVHATHRAPDGDLPMVRGRFTEKIRAWRSQSGISGSPPRR
jgi:hypothetical protein